MQTLNVAGPSDMYHPDGVGFDFVMPDDRRHHYVRFYHARHPFIHEREVRVLSDHWHYNIRPIMEEIARQIFPVKPPDPFSRSRDAVRYDHEMVQQRAIALCLGTRLSEWSRSTRAWPYLILTEALAARGNPHHWLREGIAPGPSH